MVKQIIKEAMDKNPIGLKEAVEAELMERIRLAIEAKKKSYKEEDEHDDDEDEEELEESKMTDAEVLSAAKALAKNGKDAKTKSFGQGLVDFHKENGSFTPAQVGGLQNIMKNASFQMAKESVELEEAVVGAGLAHFDDGSSTTISKDDAAAINRMFASKSNEEQTNIRKKMKSSKSYYTSVLAKAKRGN